MRALTLILPHFQNLGMLAEQQRVWADYPPALRAQLHVIVVDDCSPKGARPTHKSVHVEGLRSIRILRLLEHKRWNWLSCRNLGVDQAQTDWLLLTDIDHVLPAETLEALLKEPFNPSYAYRFGRRDAPHPWPYQLDECPRYKPHNDTWLLAKSLFYFDDGRMFVGGYDERLSGCYGTSGEFKDRVLAAAAAHVQLAHPMIRYPREIIADASTSPTVYTRKNDQFNEDDLAQRKATRATIPNWRPKRLTIKWECVYDSRVAEAVPA